MSWAVGEFKGRDLGYGVPALCDHPGCGKKIDRGLAYVCGADVYGGEHGCGLFFCDDHRAGEHGLCARCAEGEEPFGETPDIKEWIDHKENDPSWAGWRRAREARCRRCGAETFPAEEHACPGETRREACKAAQRAGDDIRNPEFEP